MLVSIFQKLDALETRGKSRYRARIDGAGQPSANPNARVYLLGAQGSPGGVGAAPGAWYRVRCGKRAHARTSTTRGGVPAW